MRDELLALGQSRAQCDVPLISINEAEQFGSGLWR